MALGYDHASYRGSDQGVRVALASFLFADGHAEGDGLFGIESVIGSCRTAHFPAP